MSDQPSIGRIVHQQHPHHGCLAAVIVMVDGDEVALDRFDHPAVPGGLLYRVRQGDPGEDETWHWPERAG